MGIFKNGGCCLASLFFDELFLINASGKVVLHLPVAFEIHLPVLLPGAVKAGI